MILYRNNYGKLLNFIYVFDKIKFETLFGEIIKILDV